MLSWVPIIYILFYSNSFLLSSSNFASRDTRAEPLPPLKFLDFTFRKFQVPKEWRSCVCQISHFSLRGRQSRRTRNDRPICERQKKGMLNEFMRAIALLASIYSVDGFPLFQTDFKLGGGGGEAERSLQERRRICICYDRSSEAIAQTKRGNLSFDFD